MYWTSQARANGRIDWQVERDRIDLADVATSLLGPPPGRNGERGRRLWWRCPFHGDQNPSFVIEPGKPTWHCFGCGEHGDAASLVMKLEHLTFPEALTYLLGSPAPAAVPRPRPRPPARPDPRPPAGPSGLPVADALALVAGSSARLWTPEGAEALAYLTGPRCLAPGTIRAARLGWTPGARVPKRDGGTYETRGIVIPWFDGDRLALAKIRQPDGYRPKYVEAYRDRPGLYPGRQAIRPGRPLIVVEGDFDALILGQELGELAAVVTLGSASGRPDPGIFASMLAAPRWFLATDADDAGDKAAGRWPARSRRARPPAPFKDWTEARQGGVDLSRWWSDRLGGDEAPPLFAWDDLAGRRWGPAADDPEPGIVIDRPDPDRRRLALESLDDPEESAEIRAEAE